MIQAGDTIRNSVTGEEITFLETARETGGERSTLRGTLPPLARGVFLHRHATFTERFFVLEGELSMIAGDPKKPLVLRPGEGRLVPIGALHRFWNASDAPVVFETEVRPARRLDEALELLFALANAGQVNPDGTPRHPFDLALLGVLSESYLPGPPMWAQRALFAALAGIAQTVGHQPMGRPRRQSA